MSIPAKTTAPPRRIDSLFSWVNGVYVALALAIFAVIVITAWGVHVDFEETRKGLFQAEINRLRSHAVRTVVRLQEKLAEDLADGSLASLKPAEWLRTHWDKFLSTDKSRVYAAVVDSNGTIVLHNLIDREGLVVSSDWSSRVVPEVGDDVVETNDPKLSGGVAAYDISLPIMHGDAEIGTYHSGLNVAWFDDLVAARRSATWKRWSLTFIFIGFVIALAGISMLHVTRRLSTLQNALAMGHVRRLADLGQLAGGIAHEIRNPLNAIRLNLHVIQRVLKTNNYDEQRDDHVIRETVLEIERVDDLLRSLLEYSRPDRTRYEPIDLAAEVTSMCDMIRPIMQRDGIRLKVLVPSAKSVVLIDRSRFRQIALNLLKNAMEAVDHEGNVSATLTIDDEIAFTVRDDGCGIDPRIAEKIFDPFFTTKELGTGLGLTLVRRTVEEEGGRIAYERAMPRGTVFTISLPTHPQSVGVSSAYGSTAFSSAVS